MSAFGIGKMLNGFGDEMMNWHILRFVKQGRGKINSNQVLDEGQLESLPELVNKLKARYSNLNISYTNSFDQKKCDCGLKNQLYPFAMKSCANIGCKNEDNTYHKLPIDGKACEICGETNFQLNGNKIISNFKYYDDKSIESPETFKFNSAFLVHRNYYLP